MITARGHKKKVKKEIKKLVIKFLIFLYVLQQATKLFLYSAQTFIFFKFMLIAAVYVATHVIKLWHFLKLHKHKDHSKVVYLDHHVPHSAHAVVDEHHPDVVDFEPSGHHDPFWARSIAAVTETPRPYLAAHPLAFMKQMPQKFT